MKKKLLTFLFSIALVIGFIPVNAFAALPDGVPSSMEAPVIKKIELKNGDEGVPYFEAQVQIPQSVLDIDGEKPAGGSVFWGWAVKVDSGSWSDFGGGGYLDVLVETEGSQVTGTDDTFYVTFNLVDEGTIEEIDIKAHTYSYKIQLSFDYYEGWPDVEPIYSPASNEVSVGTGSFYSKASTWAKTELEKADALGLIPDILKGADLTKPITREEFCELSVLLYDKTADTASSAVSPNPFTDTKNEQILKAFNIGITTGTSATTFSPKQLITREQCAAMLFRAIQAINPGGDYSVAGVADFPDQKYIATYAVAATKYMSKSGILTGDAQGNFMPKATTSAQEAAGYGMATREQAIALSVRTYEKMN
jgi:hypothetical protein